jgi:hypothetical protein
MKPPKRVKEPIQVYLDRDERALLDRLAAETGLSRAEILRQGLRRYAAHEGSGSPMLAFAASLAKADLAPDMARRHDEYLGASALDRHE